MIESLTGTHAGWPVGIIRILLGIIFSAHGAQKLLGWYGAGLAKSMRAFAEDLHLPRTLAFLVIVGEFLGGVGLVIGLFNRIPALVIAVAILGAIATVHFRFGLFLNRFGGEEGHGLSIICWRSHWRW
jgi:putative oxidoreductase